ncbi:MAG TPA: lyase family protein [Burkholderiales bacterium]|nr:lyase family protein [Burkholderiales bacterium]
MARFEGALAAASASNGVFPASHAETIGKVCDDASFDVPFLAKQARIAGALAIPFVQALTQKVAAVSSDAARYVHFGATSQDVMDTAAVLCLREACERISTLAVDFGDASATLAKRHADTPMLARTLLQPAAPVPFGWKAAMWLAPVARSCPRFRSASREACVLQFGGAAGTLAAFREKGQEIGRAIGKELGLETAPTWHSARDAFARLGAEAAILTGLAAKVARDVTLLAQPEVGEAAEPALAGRGGSSSMPHKRNPAGCLLALEAAARAPGLAATLLGELAPEHERGLGQWQSQWFTLRELTGACASGLAAMSEVLQGLAVYPEAMAANLQRMNGFVFSEALALRVSRAVADRLCAQARRERRNLLDVARADAEVTKRLRKEDLEALFEPRSQFGSAGTAIERVLSGWASARESAA